MTKSQQAKLTGKTRFYQVRKLPLVLQPNAFYYVQNKQAEENDIWEGWLTDKLGNVSPIGNIELIKTIIQEFPFTGNTVTDYRSDYETTDEYVYSGFIKNTIAIIKRCKDGVEEYAENVTDLETDWTNRLTLTYI